MATGLLVVLVGPYTRLEPYLSAAEKSYTARISFGTETDTDDAEGVVTRSAEVPAEVLDPARARELLSTFVGPASQMPPAYSAIKVGGKIAHRAARAGEALELTARPIEVFEAELLSIDAASHAWEVRFRVSKGTYIRSLARDLGRAAESAAHLSGLRRTASGGLLLADALTLTDVAASAADGRIEELFTDPIAALGLPVAEMPAAPLAHGRSPRLPEDWTLPEGTLVAIRCDGELAGIYRVHAGRLAPAAIFPKENAR
jgi:tRNA pseudouridine55 synthase